jgi:hypothetical protein
MSISVLCCYCGQLHGTPDPPVLFECPVTKRSFRVFINHSSLKGTVLTDEAKKHYQKVA